jgi:hypothetical protein
MISQPTSDDAYFAARAEEELERARQAADPAAARSHYILANFYLHRVHGAKDHPADT